MSNSCYTNISEFNCDLLSLIESVDINNFHSEALSKINTFVPFDASLWGGFIRNFKSIIPFNLSIGSQSQDMFSEFINTIIQNHLSEFMVNNSDKSHIHSEQDKVIIGTIKIEASSLKWGMKHCITNILYHPGMDKYDVISYFRDQAKHPFTDEEEIFLSSVFPLLIMGSTSNTLTNMRRILFEDFKEIGGCAAISSSNGALIEAEEKFIVKLGQEFPNLEYRAIPKPFIDKIIEGKFYLYRGNSHKFCSIPFKNDHMLLAMPLTPIDNLSPSEYDVAKYYVSGKTATEISEHRNTTISTTHNHISNIYDKLGLEKKNKAMLCKKWYEWNRYGYWHDEGD